MRKKIAVIILLALTLFYQSCVVLYETETYKGYHENGNLKYYEKETDTRNYIKTKRIEYYPNQQVRVKYKDGDYITRWRLYDSTSTLRQKVFQIDRTSVLNIIHPNRLYEGRGHLTIEKVYSSNGKKFYKLKRKSWRSIFGYGISKLKYFEQDTISNKTRLKIKYNKNGGVFMIKEKGNWNKISIENVDTLNSIDSLLYKRIIKTKFPIEYFN